MVDENGIVAWCGEFSQLPTEHEHSSVVDYRPGFLLPGFVDTHIHFPQTYAGRLLRRRPAAGVAQPLHLPVGVQVRRPGLRADGRGRVLQPADRGGTTAAMVFGSAFPHAQDALFERDPERRACGVVSGRGHPNRRPGHRAAADHLARSDAIRLTRAEIDKWHAADTGDVDTALLHVAIVPAVLPVGHHRDARRTLASCTTRSRTAGVYVHSHLNENNRPGTGEVDATKADLPGELVPRHLRRQVPARLAGRRQEPAGQAHHPGALRALPGRRARADGRDRHLDLALPGLPVVPRIGHHAVEAHRGLGRQHLARAPTSAAATNG